MAFVVVTMGRQLAGKRMLITGASSGIGRALARAAAERGTKLVLVGRSKERLDEVAAELTTRRADVVTVVGDVTRPEVRQEMLDTAVRRLGGLDILVNNAGVGAHGHFVDLDPQILRWTMEVNFFALAETCRLAVPILTEGSQPIIVNISSMAGRRGVPAWSEYSASKFAVCGFSEAFRAELARFDIDLLLIVSGLADTAFGENLMARQGRQPAQFSKGMAPEAIARRILRAIEKNKRELRVERGARLLLFVNWLLPRFVDWRMARVVRKLYAKEIAARRSRQRPRKTAL